MNKSVLLLAIIIHLVYGIEITRIKTDTNNEQAPANNIAIYEHDYIRYDRPSLKNPSTIFNRMSSSKPLQIHDTEIINELNEFVNDQHNEIPAIIARFNQLNNLPSNNLLDVTTTPPTTTTETNSNTNTIPTPRKRYKTRKDLANDINSGGTIHNIFY